MATKRASSVSGLVKTFCTASAVANCMVPPQVAAAQKYLIKLITDMSNAVLDQDTVDILEYR